VATIDSIASQIQTQMDEVQHSVASRTDPKAYCEMGPIPPGLIPPAPFPRFIHRLLGGAAFGIWESVMSGGELPNVTYHP
jgi:hypothetical protein